jgi:hypothetical protein
MLVPLPEQVSEYVFIPVIFGVTVCAPLVLGAPLHAPLATQAVAPADCHWID